MKGTHHGHWWPRLNPAALFVSELPGLASVAVENPSLVDIQFSLGFWELILSWFFSGLSNHAWDPSMGSPPPLATERQVLPGFSWHFSLTPSTPSSMQRMPRSDSTAHTFLAHGTWYVPLPLWFLLSPLPPQIQRLPNGPSHPMSSLSASPLVLKPKECCLPVTESSLTCYCVEQPYILTLCHASEIQRD